MVMDDAVYKVAFTEEEIAARVRELGVEVARDYAGLEPVLVGILKGTFIFMADLVRATPIAL
jgi:hypoxanthine phosphoribosyltransferase